MHTHKSEKPCHDTPVEHRVALLPQDWDLVVQKVVPSTQSSRAAIQPMSEPTK